ncbi:MAG: ATP-binding protein [Chitinophagales bacterium]|nr:ATP-binding protein [Chitinophagales bacterium]
MNIRTCHYLICLFCFILLGNAKTISAQDAVDSLLAILDASPDFSEERADALFALSEYYRNLSPLESAYYSEKLLELGKAINDPQRIYLGHMATGVGYAIEGSQIDKALEHFIQAMELSNTQEGRDWEIRSIKAAINVAGLHWQSEDIDKAIHLSYDYIPKLELLKDTFTLASSYEALALMHKQNESWDSVFHYLHLARNLYKNIEASDRLAAIKSIQGEALVNIGDYPAALDTFYNLLQKSELTKDTLRLMDALHSLADVNLELGYISKAKQYAYRGLALSTQNKLPIRQEDYYRTLYEIFRNTNQLDSALHYYQALTNIRNILFDEEKTRAVQEMEVRYKAKQKTQENERLKETVQAKNTQNIYLIAISILFFLLLLAIVFFYQRLRKRQAELEALNLEVYKINSQLMGLMNEKKHMVSLIAHDIRNPLSLIQLNTHALAKEGMLDEEERKEVIQEIEKATNDIDLASIRIMEIENKSEVSLQIQNDTFDVIPALQDAQREFSSYANSKNIKLKFHLPEQNSHLIKGDPFLFRHIMANFISNALKYSPHNSEVIIGLQTINNQLIIDIKDQGPGLNTHEQDQIFKQGIISSNVPTAGEKLEVKVCT